MQMQDLSNAVVAYSKAAEIEPNNSRNHTNLGAAVLRMGRQQDAINSFQAALKLNPIDAATRSNLILATSYTTSDAKTLKLLADEWEQAHGLPLRQFIKGHANATNPERRLRVGFVSADFRNHAAAYWIEPLLSSFNHPDFEVYCYYSNAVTDATTDRLRSYPHLWIDAAGMSDQVMAERIRRDAIDILVDLSSHTDGNRLLVFARQPAPIQVSWFGLPLTTGLRTVQYRVTDTTIDPPDHAGNFCTEELVYLERFYAAYRPDPSAPAVLAGPVTSNNFVTFASLNTFAKISLRVLELWATILSSVENSRLIIQSAGLEDLFLAEQIYQTFARHGVTADRLSLRSWTPMSDFLQIGNDADIALDPFPFNGGVTSCHALWMGLPVITMYGQSAASRVGVSILNQLGLADLAAVNAEGYIQIAMDLANDRTRLASLRESMRSRMWSHGLLDGGSLSTEARAAFRTMWRAWCADTRAGGQSILARAQDPSPRIEI